MTGHAGMPTTDGLTACQMSTNGWPTTSACSPVTCSAIRDSLEPRTRSSTSTPSRRPWVGRNSLRSRAGRPRRAAARRRRPRRAGRAPTPSRPARRRACPRRRSGRRGRPVPGPRRRRWSRTRCASAPGALLLRPDQDDGATVHPEAGPERVATHLAEAVLEVDDVLLAPHHGPDEAGARVLDHEVDLGLDRGRRLLHGAGMDEVVVRRAGRHWSTLSTEHAGSPEDAPDGSRRDTPGVRDAAERDGEIATFSARIAIGLCVIDSPR